jgi:hypothetical protein
MEEKVRKSTTIKKKVSLAFLEIPLKSFEESFFLQAKILFK